MDENYCTPPVLQTYSPDEKVMESTMITWPQQNAAPNFMSMLTPSEYDMSHLADHSLWPMTETSTAYPLDPLGQNFWMPQVKQEWPQFPTYSTKPFFPPTPPESSSMYTEKPFHSLSPQPSCQFSTGQRNPMRRKSDEPKTVGSTRTYRRRASSHPSVASVVSLSAHEPITRYMNGIEHITFLYSHERQVKEYTVRTDVANVQLSDISLDFRAQNAIYPRANVAHEDYDGNRWEYETSCNRLGWELCWLNKSELCGRRGLIQRAVDSYRNRHAEMRSRRVTRQEKVANGTLRKRRVKRTNHVL